MQGAQVRNRAKTDPSYRRGQRQWQVRWRDSDGIQRKKSFQWRKDADAFAGRIVVAPTLSDHGHTVESFFPTWWASKQTTSEGHRKNLAGLFEAYIWPQWGQVRLSDITPSDVAQWIGWLAGARTGSIARRAAAELSDMCALAQRDGLLSSNPCVGVRRPRTERRPQIFLSRSELEEVAVKMEQGHDPADALVVRTLGFTGMRWGELVGLQVRDLDKARRRLRLQRTVTEISGHKELKDFPKSGDRREIVAPVVWDELLTLSDGREGSEPLFPARRGGVRSHSRFHDHWRRFVQADGWPTLRIHDLRHTAASLMIASGADVKMVQRQLGHKTAAMTLDLYGALWDKGLDALAERMEAQGL